MQSKKTPASQIALGGMLAALAVVLMSLGTLIPVATYTCPMLCCLILQLVLKLCGKRIAWAWYGAVTILSILMAPDKEAAAVFAAIGYYPVVKPNMDKSRFSWLWNGLLFNASIVCMYWILLKFIGMDRLVQEFSEMGAAMTGILLVLGNVTFFLLDRLLSKKFVVKKAGH